MDQNRTNWQKNGKYKRKFKWSKKGSEIKQGTIWKQKYNDVNL